MNLTLLDKQLAERFGGYASYKRDDEPLLETYGDAPAEEVDRLLDKVCTSDKHVLDLGCGAGFTLCRLAPKVAEIWGFDEEPDLLEATRFASPSLAWTMRTVYWAMWRWPMR